MKIYNKVVYNIDTWEVLEEDSYDYDGPVALCEPTTIAWIVYIIIQLVIAYLVYSSMDLNPEGPDNSGAGIKSNTRSTREPLRVVYGKHLVGGNDVWINTSGYHNKNLKMATTVSEGEIEGISINDDGTPEIYIDNRLYTEFDNYANLIGYTLYTGTTDQTAHAAFVASEGSTWNDPMENTAYIAWDFMFDENQFRNVPTRQAVIKGIKVQDIRTPGAAKAWSDNGPLCLYDFMTNKRYGIGLETSQVDSTTFGAAATYVESQGWTCNMAVTRGSQGGWSIIEDILSGFRGSITYFNSKYYLYYADLDEESSVMTLTDEHIAQDESGKAMISVSQPSRFSSPIGMRVSFLDAEKNFSEDEIVIGEEDGVLEDLNLPTVTNREQASVLGTYALERAQLNRTITGTFRDDALLLEPHDIVTFNSDALGISDQVMRVVMTSLNTNGLINLTLQYESEDLYNDVYDTDITGIYTVDLPNPSEISYIENVTVTEEIYYYRLRSFSRLNIRFTIPDDDPWFKHVEVWTANADADAPPPSAGELDETSFKHQFDSSSNFVIDNVQEGQVYYIKLRTVNIWNTRQSLESATTISHQVVGKSDVAPPSLSYLQAIPGDGTLLLTSDKLDNPDIESYEFRLGPQWSGGIFISAKRSPQEFINNVKPGQHVFTANTKGSNGLYGDNPVTATVTIPEPQGWTAYQTFTDDYTGVLGTFTNTEHVSYVGDDYLKCSHSILFSPATSGTYETTTFVTAFPNPRWYHIHTAEDVIVTGAGTTWNDLLDPAGDNRTWEQVGIETRTWQDCFEVAAAPVMKIRIYYKETLGNPWLYVDRAEIVAAVVYARYFKIRITIEDPADNINAYVGAVTLSTHYET